ncbi:MAG TPA: metallophosphoesterase [Elusimicrobia bacterium]|nr:metallophosphoesterase [Elusimicrobiota bacterium]HBT60652.1 metallophosphoesterase [Elusimicrobiota bacterium]
MLYGVFSDVHANLEALEVVLDFFRASRTEGHICCGDVVGYGPDPEECLAKVRRLKNISIVCGNHDLAAVGRLDVEWFNPYARAATLWTRAALGGESRRFLEGLTARLETREFTVVHGTPRRPADEYLLSVAQFKVNMSKVSVWPLFMGHSHMPLCFHCSAEGRIEPIFIDDRQCVTGEVAAFGTVPVAFNPGAVGQPRDHDKRASCALWDSEARSFRVFRLAYDVAVTQAKIRSHGLPEYLALRLAYGQ